MVSDAPFTVIEIYLLGTRLAQEGSGEISLDDITKMLSYYIKVEDKKEKPKKPPKPKTPKKKPEPKGLEQCPRCKILLQEPQDGMRGARTG